MKQALQQLRQEQARQDEITDSISALIVAADEQARSEDTKLYEARLETLQKKWAELQPHATEQQTQDSLAASFNCKERPQQINAAREENARHEEQARQRTETLDLLSATLEDLQAQTPETLPSLASLDALQKTQENRWLEATRDTSVDKQQQKTYETRMRWDRDGVDEISAPPADGWRTAGGRHPLSSEFFAVPALVASARSLLGPVAWTLTTPEVRHPRSALARTTHGQRSR